MELDYEMEQIIEEDIQSYSNFCPRCNSVVIGNYCRRCKKLVPTEKYHDPDFDEYMSKVEGENAEFFEEFSKQESWKEV